MKTEIQQHPHIWIANNKKTQELLKEFVVQMADQMAFVLGPEYDAYPEKRLEAVNRELQACLYAQYRRTNEQMARIIDKATQFNQLQSALDDEWEYLELEILSYCLMGYRPIEFECMSWEMAEELYMKLRFEVVQLRHAVKATA